MDKTPDLTAPEAPASITTPAAVPTPPASTSAAVAAPAPTTSAVSSSPPIAAPSTPTAAAPTVATPTTAPATPPPAPPAAPALPSMSAAEWLKSVGLPLTEDKLESIGFKDCRELLLALLASPDAVEAAQYAIYGNGAPALATIDWLKELSKAIIDTYASVPFGARDKTDTFSRRLYLTLEVIYGSAIRSFSNGKTTVHRLNPIHFAAFFVFSQRVEYDDQIGCFFCYEPTTGRWRDVSDVEIREILMDFSIPYIDRAPSLYSGTDLFFKEILSHARAIGRRRPQRPSDWRFLLVANHTLAFHAGSGAIEHFGHSPAYRLRNRIPVNYDPKNTGYTKFREFLEELIPLKEDRELLRQWCGMVLLGQNDLHKILLLRGAAGGGKSTLINLIETVIGEDNTATLVTDRLEERFELSEFFGKTLLIGRDVPTDALTNRSAYMLKALSGDSGLKAEVKHQQRRIRIGGPFNICMVSNARLSVSLQSDADAWRRRLWVIDTVKPPSGRTPTPNYEKVLLGGESYGILMWMVKGAKSVLTAQRSKKPLTLTAAQTARIDALLTSEDTILQFISSNVRAAPGKWVTSEDLYIAYENHCLTHQLDSLRQTTFNRNIGRALKKQHPGTSHQNVGDLGEKKQKGYTDISL